MKPTFMSLVLLFKLILLLVIFSLKFFQKVVSPNLSLYTQRIYRRILQNFNQLALTFFISLG